MSTLAQPQVATIWSESLSEIGESSMKREIHFFTDYSKIWEWMRSPSCLGGNLHILEDYKSCQEQLIMSKEMLCKEVPFICASIQMCFLRTDWFDYGYRLFIHDSTGSYEVKLGTGNERTKREIMKTHNLLRMWENGEFAPQ